MPEVLKQQQQHWEKQIVKYLKHIKNTEWTMIRSYQNQAILPEWNLKRYLFLTKEEGKQTTVSCSHMYRTQVELHHFHFQDKEQ